VSLVPRQFNALLEKGAGLIGAILLEISHREVDQGVRLRFLVVRLLGEGECVGADFSGGGIVPQKRDVGTLVHCHDRLRAGTPAAHAVADQVEAEATSLSASATAEALAGVGALERRG
jgi:hypothetical protein